MESVTPKVTPIQKRCKSCGEVKSSDHFYADKTRTDGLRGKCIKCYLESSVQFRKSKRNEPRHRIRSVWRGMINRCYNQNEPSYERYGARGIRACKQWVDDFGSFFKWSMTNGWQDGLELDRIDNDGPYCPENCRYVTRAVNQRNKRVVAASGFRGVRKDKGRWAAYCKLDGRFQSFGTYDTPEEAAKARDDAVRGKGYSLNFPNDDRSRCGRLITAHAD